MKKIAVTGILLVLILFLLPVIGHFTQGGEIETEETVLEPSGQTVRILMADQTVQELDLNEYLWGVVAAEMPADFETEALKAQAVAARTYALRKVQRGSNHSGADLCTDYTCCQAWISKEEAAENWGGQAEANTSKINHAVSSTNNQYLMYNGEPIDALFHSSSGAATQDAVEVWGNDVSYLKSVSSPEGEEVPNYYTSVVLSPEQFKTAFLSAQPTADLSGSPETWVGEITRTDGGAVHSVTIGGVPVSGAEARNIFGLRSADFTLDYGADGFVFQVTGFGHGVGMSQYGANAMAKAGADYQEILQHYYTGVTIETMGEQE